MSHRLRLQKIGSSKVYSPNCLSITQNNDFSHQKMWNQKVQETKHIQQQKQIDRMLTGIVKERLFGHFLSQESRISDEGFYQMEKITRDFVNPISLPKRKISPIRGVKDYQIIPRRKKTGLHRTIDTAQLSTYERGNSFSVNKKQSFDMQLSKQRKPFIFKSLNISDFPQFSTHFRELTNNHTTMLYDIKLTKQMLFKYNRDKKVVTQSFLQKFMYFFNYPGIMNIKQLGKWIENIGNCSMRESSFFVFQALDESHNGFLTISDLFRALQNMPDNPEIEKQMYDLMGKIQEVVKELDKADIDFREIKPTVEQLLIRNPQIRLDSLRELLKEHSKELVPGGCVKSTTYHISCLALEHNAATREKLTKLQNSQAQNNSKLRKKMKQNQEQKKKMKQDGLRFKIYADKYETKRPKMFILVLQMLIGSEIHLWN